MDIALFALTALHVSAIKPLQTSIWNFGKIVPICEFSTALHCKFVTEARVRLFGKLLRSISRIVHEVRHEVLVITTHYEFSYGNFHEFWKTTVREFWYNIHWLPLQQISCTGRVLPAKGAQTSTLISALIPLFAVSFTRFLRELIYFFQRVKYIGKWLKKAVRK